MALRFLHAWRATIFVVLLGGLAVAAHSQSDGRITGKVVIVTPERRELAAGVTVKLSNPLLPAQDRETVSDEDGVYRFDNLLAGDYVLTVEARGFEKYEQKVVLQIGAQIDLNVLLTTRAIDESVIITGEQNRIETTESTVADKVTTQTLRNAPLFNERFQETLPLLPGIVRANDGSLAIKGARSNQTSVLVSSLNVTDPATGNPAINIPLESVDAVRVFANPYSAEFGKFTGAVTSVETRSGSNDLRYVLTNVLVRPRVRENRLYGVQAWTPRLAIGGALRKDKLFFFQTFEYRFVRQEIASLPASDRDTQQESFDSFTRVDYVINPRNRLTASFSVFPQKLDFFNLSTFIPRATSLNQHQQGFFLAVNEQAVFGSGALLQSGLSVKDFDVEIFPNSDLPFVITPARNTGGFFNRQTRTSRRYEVLETLTLPTAKFYGTHEPRLGLNVAHLAYRGTDTSRPINIVRRDNSLSERVEFAGDGRLRQSSTELSLFAQDKWNVNRSLTVDVGVRYDRDSIGGRNNLAPRFGFAFAPFADGSTVLRGGIGLFFDKIPLGVGTFDERQDFIITRFNADGITPVAAPFVRRNVIDANGIRNPRSLGANLQLDRELTKKIVVRLGFSERRTTRDFIVQPFDDFTPAVNSNFNNADGGVLLLSNAGRARYREFEATTVYRFAERQNVNISYVRSRAEGDLNDFDTYFGNNRNPIIRPNEYAPLPFDAPHRLLVTGNINLPLKTVVSPVVDWRSGFPFSRTDETQNFVGGRNRAGRFPRFFSLDMQILKDVTIPVPKFGVIPKNFRGKKYSGRVGFRIFNITNHFNPREVQTNIDAPDFGGFSNHIRRAYRARFEFVKF